MGTARRLPLLGLLALASGSSYAQEPGLEAEAEEVAATAQFQVEVIVFAHRDVDAQGEDFRRRRPSEPNDAQNPPALLEPSLPEVTLEDPAAPAAPPAAASPAAPLDPSPGGTPAFFRFRLLAPEELELGAVYTTLERLDAYEPLLHGGWVQDGLGEADARPFDLGLLGGNNPAGTIRLHVSRFLHVTLDLDYYGEMPGTGAAAGQNESLGLTELTLAPRYELNASRRTRRGELHYFDHPAFGVLVVVRPRPAPVAPGALPPAA
jgi:hypothetical protein